MRITSAMLAAVLLGAPAALAHEAGSHAGHSEHVMPSDVGRPGKAGEATRMVTIVATDSAFSPNRVTVLRAKRWASSCATTASWCMS